MNRHLVMGSTRELGTVTLVAALGGAYAAVLIMASSILATLQTKAGAGLAVLLGAASSVFIGIALYVAAVIISGCVTTVIAGRLRQIALLRLLGAGSRDLRRSVGAATARAGLTGAAVGVIVGTAATDLARLVLVHRDFLPGGAYPWASLWLLPALAAVTGCATVAGWVGSRRILQVTPALAMAGAAGGMMTTAGASRRRAAVSMVLLIGGAGFLALAMWMGEQGSAFGFLLAFFGSAISATGLLVGARLVIPHVVQVMSVFVGRNEAGLIARRNAVADPARTTRSTIGLVVGIALVTTFASGTAALRSSLNRWDLSPQQRALTDHMLSVAVTVMICVVLVSAVIAAVGFVSTMSLTVVQRRREIGLLRALGFTGRHVRSMITKESVALSATAVVFGIALGLIYGSVGAQSLLGAETPGFVWGLPWPVLAAISAGGVILALVASGPPARRAIAVTPVEALHVDA